MSFQAIAWAFGQKINDMAEKLVLIALAHCHNHENGKCFPSIQYLVNVTGGCRRTIVSKIGSLQSKGLIDVVPTYRKDGGQMTNAYRLNLTAGEMLASAPDPDYSTPSEDSIVGCKVITGGVQSVNLGGASDARTGANQVSAPIYARASEQEENKEENRNKPPTPLAGGIALGASTPRKRCPKSAEPSPEAKALIQEFASTYGRHFRSSYVPNAKRDVPGANALVLAGVTVDELRTRADAAMRSKAFNCKRATTLALLAELWNNVGAELQDGQRTDNTMQRYESDFELPMLK